MPPVLWGRERDSGVDLFTTNGESLVCMQACSAAGIVRPSESVRRAAPTQRRHRSEVGRPHCLVDQAGARPADLAFGHGAGLDGARQVSGRVQALACSREHRDGIKLRGDAGTCPRRLHRTAAEPAFRPALCEVAEQGG
jgi:hypothetical protein